MTAPAEVIPAGVVTRKVFRRIPPRRALWLDPHSGDFAYDDGRRAHTGRAGPLLAVGQVVELAARLGAEVVNLVGRRPGDDAAGFHGWRSGELPEGWQAGNHYLPRLSQPVLRFELAGGGRLEVQRAAAWFGEGDYRPGSCVNAMTVVAGELSRRFGPEVLRVRPAATGQECFLRTVPAEGWPTLPPELAALVRRTSGQGRIEHFAGGDDPMPRLVEVDGRFMYAALCRELPAGEVLHGFGACSFGPHTRGRWLVEWTVPSGWDGPGLLPTPDYGGWSWPAAPATRHRGWVDGAELHLARQYGWDVRELEWFVWPHRARPLDRWARELIAARESCRMQGDELAAAAVRNITLHTIGAFHSAGHDTTREATDDHVPEGRRWWFDDGAVFYNEPGNMRPELQHPEWSAAVFARCRVRMLSGPGRTGALHVPPARLLAIHTDALYLSADPGWHDDGCVGRLRVKTVWPGPFRRPADDRELLRLIGPLRRAARTGAAPPPAAKRRQGRVDDAQG